MSKKREVVPSELLSKEFLSQFKTEADVSKFLKELHSQVLEQMLQGEMDSIWVTKSIRPMATIRVTHATAYFPRRFRPSTAIA